VLQTKPHALSDEVNNHRRRKFAVAISPHHRYRRPKQSQLIQQCRSADIAQVPNLVHLFDQSGDVRRQTIVCIGDDQHFCHVERICQSDSDRDISDFIAKRVRDSSFFGFAALKRQG